MTARKYCDGYDFLSRATASATWRSILILAFSWPAQMGRAPACDGDVVTRLHQEAQIGRSRNGMPPVQAPAAADAAGLLGGVVVVVGVTRQHVPGRVGSHRWTAQDLAGLRLTSQDFG